MVYRYRLPAVQAYARANHLDRVVVDGPRRRWGLVTTGKAYLDVCGALEMLGIDDERAADIGLSVYKVGLAWPLEPHGLLAFADGLDEIIVIEEKRPFIEDQIKSLLFNVQRRPAVIGKRASNGTPQVPAEGALSPDGIRNIIGRWLAETTGDDSLATAGLPSDRRLPIEVGLEPGRLKRTPTFCSGCPHSISTTLPVGSAAMGGIGCHGMAVSMPERRTYSMTADGRRRGHLDRAGTLSRERPHLSEHRRWDLLPLRPPRHSGERGCRSQYHLQDSGQRSGCPHRRPEDRRRIDAMRGEVTVPRIAAQLRAEGVDRIAIVSDDSKTYSRNADIPRGVTFHDRWRLDAVQRELRDTKGVSALVYDQPCTAEVRRLRRRGPTFRRSPARKGFRSGVVADVA